MENGERTAIQLGYLVLAVFGDVFTGDAFQARMDEELLKSDVAFNASYAVRQLQVPSLEEDGQPTDLRK